jgi:ArsR family transcriptional regulator, arsenate/arsenite/antimonite-responsive transcriptional repressor
MDEPPPPILPFRVHPLTGGCHFHRFRNVELSGAVAALAALAQESRLALFRVLVQRGPRGLAAGQIAERMGIPGPTLSFHLGQLVRAGLVTSRREGRSVIYAADYAGMQALMGYLTDNCCREEAGGCAPAPKRASKARGRNVDGNEERGGRRT